MSAAFLVATLMGSAVWYGWHWPSSGLSFWSASLHSVLLSFAAAAIGKITGILLSARPRSTKT